MRAKSLQLKNFRNYEELDISFADEQNLFVGENAQGKTNILEAIYLCSCARSHRTGKDFELIRSGCSSYRLSLTYVEDNSADHDISITYREEPLMEQSGGFQSPVKKERLFFHNGMKLPRIADFYGLFHAVIFAPEDLMLIKGGPSARRRFLDILISQLFPSYFRDLQLYQKILTQRNFLLKKIRDQRKNELDDFDRQLQRNSLGIWNEQLAEVGARIMHKRAEISGRLEAMAAEALSTLSGQREALNIGYRCSSGLNPQDDVGQLYEQYLKKLERCEEDDLFRGSSAHGPHRDDLELSLNQLPVKMYGSQGQQRSFVLALKMAELALIHEVCGEKPVLLLDDVMSELDEHRRKSLFEVVSGHQVFITCTDRHQLFLHKENTALFRVSDGHATIEKA